MSSTRNWNEGKHRRTYNAYPSLDKGEGERGGSFLPKRLESGSGHHRLEICGPFNGRHKIA